MWMMIWHQTEETPLHVEGFSTRSELWDKFSNLRIAEVPDHVLSLSVGGEVSLMTAATFMEMLWSEDEL